jgi:hypothetical protein
LVYFKQSLTPGVLVEHLLGPVLLVMRRGSGVVGVQLQGGKHGCKQQLLFYLFFKKLPISSFFFIII